MLIKQARAEATTNRARRADTANQPKYAGLGASLAISCARGARLQGSGGLAAIQTVAPSLGVELTPVGVRDAGEIERAITAFARGPNGGLIMVGPSSSVQRHRDLIIALAARHRLPAVYPARYYVTSGGLISYGADPIDQYARPATSTASSRARSRPTCRCRRRPSTSLVINLKTAKALGLDVPPTLLNDRRDQGLAVGGPALNGFTEMLEPRDMMELMWTKEAADATWEAGRNETQLGAARRPYGDVRKSLSSARR